MISLHKNGVLLIRPPIFLATFFAGALKRTLFIINPFYRCAAPDILAGKLLSELPEDELSCEGRTTTTTTELEFLTERVTPSPEPDIITGSDLELRTSSSTKSPLGGKTRPSIGGKAEPNKMDALIIGIVGGVVAFIAIIIICICIVR